MRKAGPARHLVLRSDVVPKVVGGYDQTSCDLACQLYAKAIVQVIPVSSAEVAEACKILENTYRAVNIALVNELKILFDRLLEKKSNVGGEKDLSKS